MATHAIQHTGIDRLTHAPAGARVRWLPALMLTGVVTLIDIAVLRWFPSLDDGFVYEWIVLWALGLVLVVLFAGLALKASRAIRSAMRRAAHARRDRWEDARIFEVALRDPALMAELRALKCRDA